MKTTMTRPVLALVSVLAAACVGSNVEEPGTAAGDASTSTSSTGAGGSGAGGSPSSTSGSGGGGEGGGTANGGGGNGPEPCVLGASTVGACALQ